MRSEDSITTAEKQAAILFPADLRDWFAGQAMPALMMNACAVFVSAAKSDSPEALKLAKAAYSESAIAAGAYALADAMLEARKK